MGTAVSEGRNYKNITATATVSPNPSDLLGILVSAASATPTIKVTDGAGTVVDTFTPTAATWYPMPAMTQTNLVVTISGTVSCTVFWN